MNDLILDLYKNIQNYAYIKSYLNDANIVYGYAIDFSRADAEKCTSFYLQKYKKTLSKLGKFFGGIRLVYQSNIYQFKSDQDVLNDLIFCILGILCEAYMAIGFSKNISDFYLTYLKEWF